MDNVKQQIVDRLKQANNILVTVKNDPSIDLLSACIGLALVLGKLNKHAAAVFSGKVPSAMEFLKPEETLEPTTNSLRDFIISLDKSKADKLRYKVEDKVVRIFITPYRTSLSQEDLEFSQGDFNIDVVVALGVREQAELDAAITAHGRILHDATVVSINNSGEGSLGSLNWLEAGVSSVSELVADLTKSLGPDTLDDQIATAFLTGIVAETQRFSNDKTTPQTMRVAGELMAAGANQQLVANELQADAKSVPHGKDAGQSAVDDDGTLDIGHMKSEPKEQAPAPELPQPAEDASALPGVAPAPDNKPDAGPGSLDQKRGNETGENIFTAAGHDDAPRARSYLIDRPSAGEAAADTAATEFTPPSDTGGPNGAPMPLLNHETAESTNPDRPAEAFAPSTQAEAAGPAEHGSNEPKATVAHDTQTLEEIEAAVGAHATTEAEQQPEAPEASITNTLDDARSQVLKALNEGPQPLQPSVALNAHPLGEPLHEEDSAPPAIPNTPPVVSSEPTRPIAIEVDEEGNIKPAAPPADKQSMDMPLPQVMPPAPTSQQPPSAGTGTPPPPEPPPFMPPTFMGPAL